MYPDPPRADLPRPAVGHDAAALAPSCWASPAGRQPSVTAREGVETAAHVRRPAGKNSGCAWPPGSSRATLTRIVRAGEVPVMTGPQDPAAAGRDQLRASHADREQVIGTLKNAFVQGRLTKDELDARAGQALAARAHADLAALTADIPPGRAAAGPARPPAPARRRPLARAAAKSGICLIIAAAAIAAVFVSGLFVHGDPHWPVYLILVAMLAMLTALGIMACAVLDSWDQRSSRRQVPPRPGPGGQALEAGQRGGTGHGPVPPGPRTDQTRADLRAHKSRQHRQRTPALAGQAPRGIRPAPGAA